MGAYINANPDIRDAVQSGAVNALDHLLSNGFAEGRDLGNGINLGQFQNDPTFQQALADGGNPFDALARVAEVAPFLPSFEPPANWAPPADTPIPVDFVPVSGETLVIPPSVVVPDDMELPDTFEPVEPVEPAPQPGGGGGGGGGTPPPDVVVRTLGKLDEKAIQPDSGSSPGNQWQGSGNSPDNFVVVQNVTQGIELALNAKYRYVGTILPENEEEINNGSMLAPALYIVDANADRGWGISYSITSLGDLPLASHSFRLLLDVDPSREISEDHLLTFSLETADPAPGPDLDKSFEPSGYKWVSESPELAIIDDEGNEFVTQNTVPFIFPASGTDVVPLPSGVYGATLQALDQGGNIILQNTVTVEAAAVNLTGNPGDIATGGGGRVFWERDRSEAKSLTIQAEPDGNNVLSFNIGGEITQGFYRYQGYKLISNTAADDDADSDPKTTFDLGHGARVSAKFYIDEKWNDDNSDQQSSGIWIQMQKEDPEWPSGGAFSIIEYLDKDAAAALGSGSDVPDEFTQGFRFWNSTEGWDEYVNFDGSGWVDLSFDFLEDAHVWYVNGTEIYRDTGTYATEAERLETIIINSQNFGVDQSYWYDDIRLVGAPHGWELPT